MLHTVLERHRKKRNGERGRVRECQRVEKRDIERYQDEEREGKRKGKREKERVDGGETGVLNWKTYA